MDLDEVISQRIADQDALQERAMTDVMMSSVKEFMTLRGVELRRLVRLNTQLDKRNVRLECLEARLDTTYRLLCDMRAAYVDNKVAAECIAFSILKPRIQENIEALATHLEDLEG